MKHIQWSRLMQLFVHDLTTYSKDKIYLAVLVFFPAVISYVISNLMPGTAILLLMISAATCVFAPYYLASHICANMRTKQDSIAFAMIPATNLEKFIVRFVDYAILPVVIVIVGLIGILLFVGCAISIGHYEELRSLFEYFSAHFTIDLIDIDWSTIFCWETFTGVVMILACGFFDLALVVLGGCFFKRFALVKTWLIMLAVTVTLGGFIGASGLVDFIVESTGSMWLGIGAITLVNVGIIYAAYLLFKRKQII